MDNINQSLGSDYKAVYEIILFFTLYLHWDVSVTTFRGV